MLIKQLKETGATSDMMYGAMLASIAGSILIWAMKKDGNEANAERFGIFVGLWAPTFAILGNALETQEQTAELKKTGTVS